MSTDLQKPRSPFAKKIEDDEIPAGFPAIENPAETFKPGCSTAYLHSVRLLVHQQTFDMGTKEGREFIRSFAFRITKLKTAALRQAEALIADAKKHVADVTFEKKFFESEMTKIHHEVRQPLTELEDKEKLRIADHETALAKLTDACLFIGQPNHKAIAERVAIVEQLARRNWEEYAVQATSALEQVRPALAAMHSTALKTEAERVELEELRRLKAQIERQQIAEAAVKAERARVALAPVEPTEPVALTLQNGQPAFDLEPAPFESKIPLPIRRDTLHSLVAVFDRLPGDATHEEMAAAVMDAIEVGSIFHVRFSY